MSRISSLKRTRWIIVGTLVIVGVALAIFIARNLDFTAIPSLTTKWTLHLSAADTVYIYDSVGLDDKTAYVVTKEIVPTEKSAEETDYLRAVNAETGKEEWNFSFFAATETSPVVADGVVYFGGCGEICDLYAVEANTGQLLWKSRAGDYTQELTDPIVANWLVYFGTRSFSDRSPESEPPHG